MTWQAKSRPDSSPKSGKMGLIIGIVVAAIVVVVGGGAVAALMLRGQDPAPTPPPIPLPSPPETVRTAAATPTPVVPEATPLITLTLTGVPEGGRVYLDNTQIEGTMIQLPRNDIEHEIRVEADGFQTFSHRTRLRENQTVAVALLPIAAEIDEARPNRAERASGRESSGRSGRDRRSGSRGGRSRSDRFGSEFE